MEYWQEQEMLKKQRQKLKNDYPDIGKIVQFKGEVGVVVFSPDWKIEDEDPNYKPGLYTEAYAVRWDTKDENDYEQYGFFDYKYLKSYNFKFINIDGTLKNK